MKARIMFSGGKDSSLAAILLEPFFNIELVTCSFSLLPVDDVGKQAAMELGFSHRSLYLEMDVLHKAMDMILDDGFPKNAINYIHKSAIEVLAADADVDLIADGIRRDDRVPRLEMSEIRSIEDRFDVQYISPLCGYGRHAVDVLVKRYLKIEEGLSDTILKADYETELRELIRQHHGNDKVSQLFPVHVQSRTIKRVR